MHAAVRAVVRLLRPATEEMPAAYQHARLLSTVGDAGRYWVPPEPERLHGYSQSMKQQRFTSRFEQAIESSLLTDTVLRESLVEQNLFTIHNIRLSNDRRTAYVLWDCHPERVDICERFLKHNAFRLRNNVGRLLRAKQVPYLTFKHDRLPESKAALASAIEEVEKEYEDDSTPMVEQDVLAASKELEAEMGLKKRYRQDHSQAADQ